MKLNILISCSIYNLLCWPLIFNIYYFFWLYFQRLNRLVRPLHTELPVYRMEIYSYYMYVNINYKIYYVYCDLWNILIWYISKKKSQIPTMNKLVAYLKKYFWKKFEINIEIPSKNSLQKKVLKILQNYCIPELYFQWVWLKYFLLCIINK